MHRDRRGFRMTCIVLDVAFVRHACIVLCMVIASVNFSRSHSSILSRPQYYLRFLKQKQNTDDSCISKHLTIYTHGDHYLSRAAAAAAAVAGRYTADIVKSLAEVT